MYQGLADVVLFNRMEKIENKQMKMRASSMVWMDTMKIDNVAVIFNICRVKCTQILDHINE